MGEFIRVQISLTSTMGVLRWENCLQQRKTNERKQSLLILILVNKKQKLAFSEWVLTSLLKCFRNIKISSFSKLQYCWSIETKCVKRHGKTLRDSEASHIQRLYLKYNNKLLKRSMNKLLFPNYSMWGHLGLMWQQHSKPHLLSV